MEESYWIQHRVYYLEFMNALRLHINYSTDITNNHNTNTALEHCWKCIQCIKMFASGLYDNFRVFPEFNTSNAGYCSLELNMEQNHLFSPVIDIMLGQSAAVGKPSTVKHIVSAKKELA